MSEALEKILPLDFAKVEKTEYANALKNLDKDGKGIWEFVGCSAGVGLMPGMILCLVAMFVSDSPVGVFLSLPVTAAIFALGGGIFQKVYLKIQSKCVLGNRVKRFEWQVAKAIEIHNLRVRAFNNQLEWRALGYPATDDEALQNIRGLLVESEELMRREQRIYECAKEGALISAVTNVDNPELTDNLAGLLEAEKDLLAHVAAIGPGGSSPIAKMLENEASRLELETEFQGLLSAKSG